MRNVFENISWLLADKVSKLFPGILVLALLARHLGPEEFGIWNYAIALTTIVGNVAVLGMDRMGVQELIHHEGQESTVVATIIFMRVVAALLCMAACILLVFFSRPLEPVYLYCTVFSAFTIFFQSFDVMDYFYQVKSGLRNVIVPRVSVFVIFCFIKILLVYLQASLYVFLWATLLELITTYAVILIRYGRRYQAIQLQHIDMALAGRLLRKSWPLIFSNLVVVLFVKLDLVLLDWWSNPDQLGNYVVAIRISELWYALPAVMGTAMLPGLIQQKKDNTAAYLLTLERWLRLSCWASLCVALVVSVATPAMVRILYGTAYKFAAVILMIHIWACIPVFLLSVMTQYLFVEGKYRVYLYGNITGLLVNVAINGLLIPSMGGAGAAIATVVAYSSVFVAMVCMDKTGKAWILTQSMVYPLRVYADMKQVQGKLRSQPGIFNSNNPLSHE